VFSHRTARPRAPNALAVLLAQSPAPHFDLCGSNPTTAGIPYPPELWRCIERAVAESHVYRPEPFGSPSARAAVARHFAKTRAFMAPDVADVLLTASTSEAYSFVFKLLCDPGDEVLVPAPSYPLLEHLAELEAVKLAPYRLAYDGAWHIDLESVRRAVTSRTRALIVVSPNNPTGQYSSVSELAALAELGLPLVSDEVFFEYPLLERATASLLPSSVLGFALGGLSKLSGAPQLKLAWTILSGPEPARREARERFELIADAFLSVSSPVQHALPELLDVAGNVTSAIGARCRENLEQLRNALANSSATLLRAEGGWSAVLRLPSITTEDQFVLGLLRERGVLVQPGWFYDFETQPFVVLSLLTEPGLFREGAALIAAHVAALGA
jgi:alanine-synthesizing transaminase